jgi:hypothetical protein
MPRVTEKDWRGRNQRSRRWRGWLVVAAVFALFITAALPALYLLHSEPASATPNIGPDEDDFEGQQMSFVVDNSVYVGADDETIKLYFNSPTGNSIDIRSAGLTNTPTFDTIYTDGGGNPVVVTYSLYDGANTTPFQTCNANVSDVACTWAGNINLTSAPNPAHGYYEVTLKAKVVAGTGWNFSDGFWVNLKSGEGIVGYDSKSNADKFAMQERITDDRYTDWTLRFGSDCTVIDPAGKTSRFYWYDPDNGTADIQPNKSSFTIEDVTGTPTRVDLFNPAGNDFTTGSSPATLSSTNVVTPGNNTKTSGSVDFIALPQHIYEVHWNGVWSNNTLQFQLPYDSIFYFTRGCAANYDVNLSATTAPAQSVPAVAVAPGDILTIHPILNNTGVSTSPNGTLQVMYPGAAYVPVTTPVNQTGMSKGGAALGYRASSTISGVAGANWGWSVTGLAPGSISNSTLQFQLSPTAPVGTFTMRLWYYPATSGGPPVTTTVSFRVVSVRSPGLAGINSDIHAGSGACQTPASPGHVTTSPNSGSYGQYVISATSTINNIDSNNRQNDTLKLGNNGSYKQVCRPDLLKAAVTGGGPALPGPGPIDLGGLTSDPAMPDVYFWNGATDLVISGVVHRKLTIVAPNANVVIGGNITIDPGAFSTATLPSLGVIAKGNILIQPGATVVAAYLFANGRIDTCNGGGSACVTPTLVVDGFLMAKDITFGRLGAFNSTSSLANPVYGEVINMNPQLYINPPKYFDASVDDNQLEGQGERPPLF